MSEASVKLFISYSHKDELLRQQLDAHLAPLKGQNVISAWHDRQIRAGDNWAEQIDENLNKADIILLLVSSDFVASKFCSEIELKQAIARYDEGEAMIVPVILRPSDWSWLPYGKFQAFPKNAQPITTWSNWDEAFDDVAKGIRAAAESLLAKRRQKSEQRQSMKARYLQKVEEALSDGAISDIEQDTLDELRDELGLSDQEAKEIQSSAFEPYRKCEKDRDNYRKTLHRLINKGLYPFSDQIKEELKLRRRDLGLAPEDAEKIEQPILEQAKIQYEEKQQAEEAERQRQLDLEAETPRKPDEFTRQESTLTVQKHVEFQFSTIAITPQGWKGKTLEVMTHQGTIELFEEAIGEHLALTMAKISGGTFRMGSPDQELEHLNTEGPQHSVTIAPFFISRTLITQQQWRAVAQLSPVTLELNPEPSHFTGDLHPVEQVSWFEAVEFCDRLSRQTGRSYRLPNEAEWEYACRAKTTSPFHFGETLSTDIANYRGTNYLEHHQGNRLEYKGFYGEGAQGRDRGQTTEVMKFPPNAFGLYDLHGNLYEWCADIWHDDYTDAPTDGRIWAKGGFHTHRVLRGGSWATNPGGCRSASRLGYYPEPRVNIIGFRVVCDRL